jgi:ethanolamine utilization microcompartment shell protein EutS
MRAIYGDYHNATNTSTGGWAVTDKLFGYLGALTTDYSVVKRATLTPSDPGYAAQQAALKAQNVGVLGLQKPLGAIVIFGGIGLAGYIIYSIVNK